MNILIADDNEDVRLLQETVLATEGYTVHSAANGLEALNAFVRAHNEKTPYHLIFLDIEMQGLDGHQVMKKIRQWENSKATSPSAGVKIILLSAGPPPEKILPLLEPGHETWMEKPVTRDRLAQAFKQIHYA